MGRIAVLKQRGTLFVSMPEDIDDASAGELLTDILERVEMDSCKGVIVDLSALEFVDSFLGRIIADIANCSSVLDARTVVCGMRPAVAITLVELGMDFPRVSFAMDIEEATDQLQGRA